MAALTPPSASADGSPLSRKSAGEGRRTRYARFRLRIDSPAARVFAQIAIVALAAFISSGLGLLSYLSAEPPPTWLRLLAIAAGTMALGAFLGWLLASLNALARGQYSLH